jgi:pyruvate kinase
MQRGDSMVLTGGHPIYRHGQTNFLKVITLE